MSQKLDLCTLDSIRAETMMALLTAEGRKEIWKYDIVRREAALREAISDQNYDNMEAARANRDKPFALIGPGIDDCYFSTVAELVSILFWVCQKTLGGKLAVAPENTYANQQAFLAESKAHGRSFIPLAA